MRKSNLVFLGVVLAVAALALAVWQLDSSSNGRSPGSTVLGNYLSGLSSGEPVRDAGSPKAAPPEGQVPQPVDQTGLVPAVESDDAAYGGSGGESPPLPSLLDRKIIRTATLSLTVEDVAGAVQRVENAAIAAGGFVSGSSLTTEEVPPPPGEEEKEPQRRQRATVSIRVPAEAYASVMSQLRGIAEEVRSESSQSSEVTEEYTDLKARLRNLEATEAQYLELLAQAKTIPDILTVQDRINSVRLEIEQVQGRLNLLDDLTELATITVELAPPPLPSEEGAVEEPQNWAEEAWEDATEASEDVLKGLGQAGIIGVVVLAWVAVPALVIAVIWRLLGPRGAPKGQS